MRRIAVGGWVVLAACGQRIVADVGDGESSASGIGSGVVTSSTEDSADGEDDNDPWRGDMPAAPDPPPLPPTGCDEDTPCLLDVLVVIDNSSSMAPTQAALVRGLVGLVGQLEVQEDLELPLDVQMMFTTTDVGNPYCEGYNDNGYESAMGAPTIDGCNRRITDFTGLGSSPEQVEGLCTDFCPADVVPSDPFVAFAADGSNNVGAGVAGETDIDDDGVPDSAVKRAVGCLAPQGINGCGFEAPLEAMLRALDPDATWNSGDRPFLREHGRLVIVIATDEADCSATDFEWLTDPQYWEEGPGSSAACWDAGITCEGPNREGVYTACVPTAAPLAHVSRYSEHLAWIAEAYGTEVEMIAITGVPSVTARNDEAPFEPVAGGVDALIVHDWRDALVPDGDMLPGDDQDADDLQGMFGIGPGCAVAQPGHVARAIPNHRVNEVCRRLDDQANVDCCIESACDETAALDCVIGWTRADRTRRPGE